MPTEQQHTLIATVNCHWVDWFSALKDLTRIKLQSWPVPKPTFGRNGTDSML